NWRILLRKPPSNSLPPIINPKSYISVGTSMEGALNFRLRQDNNRPNTNGQSQDTAGGDARNHGDDAGSHRQAMVFEFAHLNTSKKNQTAYKNSDNGRYNGYRPGEENTHPRFRRLTHGHSRES